MMRRNWKRAGAWIALIALIINPFLSSGLALAQEEGKSGKPKWYERFRPDRSGGDETNGSWLERQDRARAQSRFEEGKAAYERGDYALAERRLTSALKKDPSLFEARRYLGLACFKQGKWASAYNEFAQYLAVYPEDSEILLLAGIAGEKSGQDERAKVYLEAGLKEKPDDVEAMLSLARVLLRGRDAGGARIVLDEVVQLRPNSGEAWLLLGQAHRDLGEMDEAEAAYKKALAINPEDVEANFFLGKQYFDRGEFDAAAPYLTRAAGKHEPAAESHYMLAVSLVAASRDDQALDHFEAAYQADPEGYSQAMYQAALIYEAKGDDKKAADLYEKYAEKNANHFDSRLRLARILLKQGKKDEAKKWMEQAARLDPNNSAVLFEMGKLYYESGDYIKAYPYLRKALSLDPNNQEIRYLLSQTYLQLPDLDAAERELTWILSQGEDPEARAKLEEVRRQREALAKDPAAGVEAPPEKTVAVAEFKNQGSDQGWDWLQSGLAEIMVQDLAVVTSVTVVNPAAVNKLMREDEIQPGSISPAFSRLGAQALITGGYTVKGGEIQVQARIVETQTTRVLSSVNKRGPSNNVYQVEREALIELISGYASLTQEEIAAINKQPTLGVSSLQDFAAGKQLYYMGKGEQAKSHLEKVVAANPNYTPAAAGLKSVQDALKNAETLAIMPFKNVSGDQQFDWMGLGVSEALTTDLKKITGIYLVERADIDKALEEMKLGLTGLTDESTAPKVGKMVGASVILVGSFQVANGRLRIDARMVDVETGGILLTEKVQGLEDDIFKLEEQLAVKIAEALHVTPTAEEMARLKDKPNIENYKTYIVSQSSFKVGKEGEKAGADEEVIHTVAVSRFKNLSGAAKYDHLEEAISGYVVTELKGRGGFNMIEREQLDNALTEMKLGQTAYVDDQTAPQLGQLVGADAILIGFFQVSGTTIRIDARVIKVDTGEVLTTVSVDGSVNDLFKVEAKLADQLLATLGAGSAPGSGGDLASTKGEGGPAASARKPLVAAAYSFLLPGSAQYLATDKKTKGAAMLVADALLILGAAFLTMQADQGMNDYSSSGDSAKYNDAVDQLNMRNMLIYGIIGLGIYSAIDAYVEVKKTEEKPAGGTTTAQTGAPPATASAQPNK